MKSAFFCTPLNRGLVGRVLAVTLADGLRRSWRENSNETGNHCSGSDHDTAHDLSFKRFSRSSHPAGDRVNHKAGAPPPGKDSLRLKRKVAAWDDDFLASLIAA